VAIAAVCMIALTTKTLLGRASCSDSPVLVNVAASDDIAPAVHVVANAFNSQNATSGGRCVQVQVDEADSATEAAQVDGQATRQGAAVDAWIPDSSLWVDVARAYPVGAQVVQPTGKSVARSPLMLVTTEAVATETGIFTAPPSWDLLLPSSYGGPPASMAISVDLPDPTTSAAGLASLIEVSRQLGTGPTARTAVTDFALGVQSTENFDSASALAQFVATTQPPFDRKALTVATEQAVLAYDRASPKAPPLDAVYPTSANQALGTPELDYPYVLTSAEPAEVRAATMFGKYLQTSYAQSVMRTYGFRSANGLPDVMPASTDLAAQPMELASAASPTEAAANLQVWQRLGLGFRDLVLQDVSPAMKQPSGLGTLTLEQLLTQTASKGLGLFPDGTQMGVWEIGKSSAASPSYDEVVPIGPLSANVGLLTRRAQIEQIDATATTSAGPLALYNTILAAYQKMSASYAPQYVNAVILLTSGVDSARGDISASSLVAQLQKLYNPNRKVEIIALMFGSQGNFPALQEIADATGGAAFQVTNPAEIGQIFVEAMSQRMCNQGCESP
jgi:Ca-activated chloride channel homolog